MSIDAMKQASALRAICAGQRKECMNAHSETRQWTEEDYLHEQLRMLQINYEKAAKPIIDRLVRIRSMDTKPSILVSIDQLPADMRATIAKATGGEA